MVEMGERSVVVRVTGVLSPFWLISQLLSNLHVFLNNTVWASFSMVEVSEWTIVVGVSRVLSPFWFVLFTELNIFLVNTVW